MVFDWFRNRRRRTLRERPFPDAWRTIVERNVLDFHDLAPDERQRVLGYVQVFTAEKNWEGCGGLAMTDEVRVTIAAQVGILTVNLAEPRYFDAVLSILVYPQAYVNRNAESYHGGVLTLGDSFRSGEAWYRGPVVLSWADVLGGALRHDRGNVVYHEFAHQLDMLNGGSCDGVPPLETRDQDARWLRVNDAEYARLVQACEHGAHTVIGCYGATNRAEFLAVTTETFFTRPHALREHHPELYDVFREVYRQDPAERMKGR
ncbi:MAG: zinc-dependent peptidase [Pirellulales bacterium]